MDIKKFNVRDCVRYYIEQDEGYSYLQNWEFHNIVGIATYIDQQSVYLIGGVEL